MADVDGITLSLRDGIAIDGATQRLADNMLAGMGGIDRAEADSFAKTQRDRLLICFSEQHAGHDLAQVVLVELQMEAQRYIDM